MTLSGVPMVEKKFQDTNFSKFQDNFRTFSPSKTLVNVDKAYFLQASHHKKNCLTTEKLWKIGTLSRTNMGQKRKLNKKAYLYVTDIGADQLGNLAGYSRSQVCSPSLQNGGLGVTPPRKFWKSIFNLVHSDAFFNLSGQFRPFLPFFRTT